VIRFILLLAATSACNTSNTSSSGVSEWTGGAGGTGGGGGAQNWAGKKLVPETGEVDGVEFTIDVPEGLPRDGKQKGDWGDSKGAFEHAPKVVTWTIETRRVQSLDDAKYNATTSSRTKTWVRSEARPNGWAVTYAEPDKSRIEAVTYRQVNDELFLKCKAFQDTGSGELPSYDKTRAMLEAVCDSVKPGTPKSPAPPKPED
jgi:hypothetical protein